jgi:hypothetical protein
MMPRPPSSDAPKSNAELLDEVMRGQQFFGPPPGTIVASLFVPLCALGVTTLSLAGSMLISAITTRPAPGLPTSLAVAVVLLTPAILGNFAVVLGHGWARRNLKVFVAGLLAIAVMALAASIVVGASAPRLVSACSSAALAGCSLLLASRSYLAYASFFSLKRKYRSDQKAARDVALEKSPHRRS